MQGISLSPSFSCYSDGKVAEIAVRIAEEFESDEFYFKSRENSDHEEEEFKFVTVEEDSEFTSAAEIFRNGEIRPVYPVFDRDLLLGLVEFQSGNGKGIGVRDFDSPKIRLPLRKLFHEERETRITSSSGSSSEADDELEGATEESYCVWPPKAKDGRCKKSNSADSDSRRWKLRDFLHRSHNDGRMETPADVGKVKLAAPPTPPPFDDRNGGEKQRSYLLYGQQDLVGIFGNVNRLGKSLQPY